MRGQVLAGRYWLVEPLGSGRRIWLARDSVLHRDVAIVRIPVPAGSAAAREEALAAARAAAGLGHPALVTVHDVIADAAEPYLVTDFVRGRSLDRIVREKGPLPTARTAVIGLRLLDALGAVHARNLTHGAVMPENVLIADTGEVVLAGLGLAPAPGPGVPGARHPRDDLRALGATLFFAMEGRAPDATPPRPGPIAHIPHALSQVPCDLPAIRAALEQAAATGRPPAGLPDAPAPTARRNPWPVILAGAAALAVAAAGYVLLRGAGTSGGPPVTAGGTASAAAASGRPRPATPRPETPTGTPGPNPCALVASDPAKVVVGPTSCWADVGATTVIVKAHPDAPTARAVLDAIRKRQISKTGGSSDGESFERLRDIPGLGDEAFAQDTSPDPNRTPRSHLWLRLGVYTVEVRSREDAAESGRAADVLRAARTVAARLAEAS